MQKILVLCTGNSCRSQMLEGFLKAELSGKALIYSAGVEAHGLNPRAIQVMAEAGIDISGHSSDLVTTFLDEGIDTVVTVCDHAAGLCPVFPEKTEVIHHRFPDPAKATGSEEEILTVFRKVRDEIRDFAQGFVTNLK